MGKLILGRSHDLSLPRSRVNLCWSAAHLITLDNTEGAWCLINGVLCFSVHFIPNIDFTCSFCSFYFFIFFIVFIFFIRLGHPQLYSTDSFPAPCTTRYPSQMPSMPLGVRTLKNHNKNTNRYTHTHHHPRPTPTSVQAYSASRRSRTAMTLSVRPARFNSLPDCAGGTVGVVTHRAANGKMGVEDEDEEDESRNLVPAIPSDPFKLHTQHPRTPMTPMGPENAQ